MESPVDWLSSSFLKLFLYPYVFNLVTDNRTENENEHSFGFSPLDVCVDEYITLRAERWGLRVWWKTWRSGAGSGYKSTDHGKRGDAICGLPPLCQPMLGVSHTCSRSIPPTTGKSFT